MEELRLIAERTVKEANVRLIDLTAKAFQLHDDIQGREKQLSAPSSSPELDDLRRQRFNDTLEMINQEACILAFDPSRILDDSDCNRLEKAMAGLSLENKRKKNIFITVFFGYVINDSSSFFYRTRNNERIPLFSNFPAEFWKDDKAIILVAVQRFPMILGEQGLVSDQFLNDSDVFLAFLAHVHYTTFYPWRDESFRRLVCRFSSIIRADRTLMLALVKKCGRCLNHVDESIKWDREIIRAACIQNPSTISNCSDSRPVVELLLQDKAFVLSVIDAQPARPDWFIYGTEVIRQFYTSLPEQMQHDVDIARVMLRKGYLSMEQLFPGDTLERGRDFWHDACQYTGSYVWRLLPRELKDDPEFLETIRFENIYCNVHEHVLFALQDRRELATSRGFWTAVIKTGCHLEELIRDHAGAEILQDRDLMLLACTQESEVFRLLAPDLQQDKEFLRAMIEVNGAYAFPVIPLPVQSMYPDYTAKALCSLHEDFEEWVDLSSIAPDLWTHPEVMKAYVDHNFSVYGFFDNELHVVLEALNLPVGIKDNEIFAVFAAELCARGLGLAHWGEDTGFAHFASESLRSNKAFMMKAVEINPRCRAAAAGDLVEDFDLAVMAFSRKIVGVAGLFGEHEDDEDHDYEKERQLLRSVAAKAREKVLLFEWHTHVFAPIFDNNAGNAPPGCNFPELFQDDETAQAMKKEILGCCGVPDEEHVKNLGKASLYLLFMHPHDPHCLQGVDVLVMPKPERFFSCD